MLRTTLAGLLAHKTRLLLTAVAITLGVGFISGTFVLTDTSERSVQKTFARSADKIDTAVLPVDAEDGLPAETLARVRTVPGVVEAQGLVRGDAALVGRDGKAAGDFPTVGLSITGGRLQRHEFERGRAPSGPGEAVLDARIAEREKFTVGDTVTVLDHRDTPHRFSVVGLVDMGLDSEAEHRGAVGFDPATAARMTGSRTYTEIDVVGADPAAVRPVVGPAGEVLSGTELADRLSAEAGADTRVIRAGLLLFGLVAMLVSALVIYNTFAILIAQRMRETALLRCVGATRRQVFGGVVVESLAVGFVGSLLGLAAGLGLGACTLLALNTFGVSGPDLPDMPASEVALTPLTVAAGLAVGVVVTVISALLPARAATRVAPVAALRSEPEPGSARFRLGRPRTVLAALLGGLGLAVCVFGVMIMDKGPAAMYVVAVAGGLVFLCVVVVMPALVRPLGRLVGALPGRLAGVPGRLAVENARRSPRRTATTTIALTIGVGLMSLFAVIAASSKAEADGQLAGQFPVDFQLQTQLSLSGDQRIPRALGGALRGRPELGTVIEQRSEDGRVGGRGVDVTTVTDGAIGGVLKPEFTSGSARDLRPGTALVNEVTAKARGLRTGQTVTITGDRDVRVKVAGVFGGDIPMYGIVLTGADFDRAFAASDPSLIYVKAAPGVPADRARIAVEDAARPYPTAKVVSAAEIREEYTAAIDAVLLIFGGLLGLAIVIALFGIANTLTLSVVERTRESALLRALGLTRHQLRRMLSVEALVMSVIGAMTGVVLGVGFGWAAIRAAGESVAFAVPLGQIAGFMVLAGAAGVLAAVLPARRAARASIVESLSFD